MQVGIFVMVADTQHAPDASETQAHINDAAVNRVLRQIETPSVIGSVPTWFEGEMVYMVVLSNGHSQRLPDNTVRMLEAEAKGLPVVYCSALAPKGAMYEAMATGQ